MYQTGIIFFFFSLYIAHIYQIFSFGEINFQKKLFNNILIMMYVYACMLCVFEGDMQTSRLRGINTDLANRLFYLFFFVCV